MHVDFLLPSTHQVASELMEIQKHNDEQLELHDNLRSLLDGVRTQVSANSNVCQSISQALEELHVERRTVEAR